MSATLSLSPQVFAILSALVEEHLGLHYDLHERELFADRVSARAVERGFESLLDYYYFLRYDPARETELALLADSLVVNETYFFREPAALNVLVSVLVPELIAQGLRPRIWCAACATGEEPLTLAMLLEERNLLHEVTLVASDLSGRALAHARAGIYRRRSLRALPPHVVGKWLSGTQDEMRVAPHLIEAIEWRQVNLTDERATSALGEFDAILCRNVLIYFSDRTIAQVSTSLWRRLRENGRVVVGASESLLRFDVPFACEEQGGAFFYRKLPK